jgi:hypothetical protein
MIDGTHKSYEVPKGFKSADSNYPLDKYFDLCDVEKFLDFKYFVCEVNKRSEWQRGLITTYDYKEYALNPNTEYFHPMITYDDRMVYIAENIVGLSSDTLSLHNKIGNTIISHFYGARGIHQIATRNNDVKTAHVDFENYFTTDERSRIRENLKLSKIAGLPIYGSTELRTSLWGAANKYQQSRFNVTTEEERKHPGNIMDWVAGLCEDGTFDRLISCNSIKEAFNELTSNAGIGSYYGFHCATSNSVNPELNWTNDDNFVKPGPGAQYTLKLMFPNATNKLINSGDLVIWFRHNQKFFGFGDIEIHESAHNILNFEGKKILEKDQTEMMTYGSEVAMCQYGIFCKLREDKKACDRRKVARIGDRNIEKMLNMAEQEQISQAAFQQFFT